MGEVKLMAWPINVLYIADNILWQCLLQNVSHISKESLFLSLIQDSVKTQIWNLTYSMKLFWLTVANYIEINKKNLNRHIKVIYIPAMEDWQISTRGLYLLNIAEARSCCRQRAVSLLGYGDVKASHKCDEPNIHIHDTSKPQDGTKITAIPQEQPQKSP